MGTASTSSLWQFHGGNIVSPLGQAVNSSGSSDASTLFGTATPSEEKPSLFGTTSSHFGVGNIVSPFGQAMNSSGSSVASTLFGTAISFADKSSPFGTTSSHFGGGNIVSPFGQAMNSGGSSVASTLFGTTTPFAEKSSPFGTTSSHLGGYTSANQNQWNAFQQSNSQCSPPTISLPSSQSSFISPFGSTSTVFGISPSFKNGCASGDSNVDQPLSNSASKASSTTLFGAPRNLGFDFKSTPSIFQSNAALGSTSSIFGVPNTPPLVPRSESSGFSTNIFGLPITNTSPLQFSTTTGSGFHSPVSTSASGSSSSSGSPSNFTIGEPSTSSFSFSTPSQYISNSVAVPGSSSNGISGTPSSSGSQGTTTLWRIGSTTGKQSKGSRITPYSVTQEKVEANGRYLLEKIHSISAMPVYKDKSHEELRMEDYESSNKGGNRPWEGQSGFKSSDKQAKILSFPPETNFSPVTSVFNPVKSNPSPSKMQAFNTPTSTVSMFPTSFKPVNPFSPYPSIFPPQSQSSQPQSTVISSMTAFTPTINAFSLSSPVSQSMPANNCQWPPSSIPFTSSHFSTISSNKPSSTFSPSILSTPATTLGPWPSFLNASHPGQTAQNVNFLPTTNLNEPPQVPSGLIKATEIASQNINEQQYIASSTVDMQSSPVVNPFGLRTEVKISVGQLHSTTSINYGISSIPVSNNPSPVGRAPLLRIRHVSLRHSRLSAQRHNSGSSEPKVPFFSDTGDKPCVVDPLMPRNNPRAWVSNSLSGKENAPLHTCDNGEVSCGDKASATYSLPNVNSAEVTDEVSVREEDLPVVMNLHLADDLEVVKQHNNDVLPLMPKLNGDYYTEPSIDLLAAKEKAEPGFCSRVNDFVVGRRDYGSIKFLGETDVRSLNLESIIQFNNREVIVYVDDRKKPPVGQSLNKPAEVTLLNVKCISKKSGMQYTKGLQVQNYKQMLIKKTEEQGAEFISYDPVRGEWKFRVQHF